MAKDIFYNGEQFALQHEGLCRGIREYDRITDGICCNGHGSKEAEKGAGIIKSVHLHLFRKSDRAPGLAELPRDRCQTNDVGTWHGYVPDVCSVLSEGHR